MMRTHRYALRLARVRFFLPVSFMKETDGHPIPSACLGAQGNLYTLHIVSRRLSAQLARTGRNAATEPTPLARGDV